MALFCLAGTAVAGDPAAVLAVNPWVVTLHPTVLTEGVPTDVTVTVAPGSDDIGCVLVDVPAGFKVVSAKVSSVPAGFVWGAAVSGSGPTWVTSSTTKDQWRLNPTEQAVFIVRVAAEAWLLPSWGLSAYKKFTVTPTQLVYGPSVPLWPFTIVPTGTPTPGPTPTPTPARTPEPTPKHTPSPVPSHGPAATPSPTSSRTTAPVVTRSPSAGVSASPAPTASPTASPSASAAPSGSRAAATSNNRGAGGVSGAGPAGGNAASLDVGGMPAGVTVQFDSAGIGGIGMFAWVVPGLFLSLPGLLLILIVLAQAGFATVFVPVTRRVLGAERRRRARQHSMSPG